MGILARRTTAAVFALCLAVALPLGGAETPPAGVQLRARVLPSLRLEPGSPQVTGPSSGASAFNVAADTLRVEVTLPMGGTDPVTVRVPLTMHANVRTFLLRAHVADATDGEIALEGAADVWVARPFALGDGQVFAMASSEKFSTAPIIGSLLLTLAPAPDAKARTVTVVVTMEAPAR